VDKRISHKLVALDADGDGVATVEELTDAVQTKLSKVNTPEEVCRLV